MRCKDIGQRRTSTNRDARAINLKLDELIRAIDKAQDRMMNIEKLSDVELDVIEKQYARLGAEAPRANGPPSETTQMSDREAKAK